MKLFLILATAFSLFSCGASKNAVEGNTGEGTSADGKLTGTVRVNYKGCSTIIETSEEGKLINMYVVNLEDAYKVDGLKIKFTYLPSRAVLPEGCSYVNKTVVVENVEKLK